MPSSDSFFLSREDDGESTLSLHQRVESLKVMDVRNSHLQAQVSQTKQILLRLEENQIKNHELQLNSMFKLQKNNNELQQSVLNLKEENCVLKGCIEDLENEVEGLRNNKLNASRHLYRPYSYNISRSPSC